MGVSQRKNGGGSSGGPVAASGVSFSNPDAYYAYDAINVEQALNELDAGFPAERTITDQALSQERSERLTFENTVPGLISVGLAPFTAQLNQETSDRQSVDQFLGGQISDFIAQKGVANGLAPLDSNGLLAAGYLPSYVDDVLEAASLAALPATGETGKIYVTLDTNKTYRWSGTVYVEISASPGSTDAVTEGSINLYFTVARVLAVVLAGLSTATNSAITAADTILTALGKLQAQNTANTAAINLKADTASPTFTGTVSGITKSMVGLGSVDNTSDAGKPVSTAQQAALDLKANLASPTFTGTVGGITKSMVGLSNVPNTDATARANHTGTQLASTISDFAATAADPNPSTIKFLFEDYLDETSQMGSGVVSGGVASRTSSLATAAHPGVVRWRLTTLAGSVFTYWGFKNIVFGGGVYTFRSAIQCLNLSDGTDDYIVRAGFGNNIDSTEPVQGIYFEYDRSVSTKWQMVTVNGSGNRTKTATTVDASVNFQALKIVVNAAGTSAEFFIDGVSVGTQSSNFPSLPVHVLVHAVKRLGNGQKDIYVDYISLGAALTATR